MLQVFVTQSSAIWFSRPPLRYDAIPRRRPKVSKRQFPTRTAETTRTALPTLSVLVVLALPGYPALANDESEELPELEVLARYEVPERYDQITGVQWAGKDSVYLGLFDRGVVEVDLRDGLPEVDHLFGTRGEPPHLGLEKIVRFDVSDDWIVGLYDRFAWAPQSSGGGPAVPMVQRTGSGAFTFAVDGDRIVLLGLPNIEHWKENAGGILWRADLSKGLDSWDVLYKNEEIATNPRLFNVTLATRGSVEFLDDGDVLLAPNVPGILPTAMRFSYQGKLKETWNAEELWESREEGDAVSGEEEAWTEGLVSGKTFGKFLSRRRLVDAILALPEGPALVVREPKGSEARWRLVVLSPEVRWYDIPVTRISSVAQFRGDADNEGRIVVVGAIRELWDEAQVKQNEVVVMRLPLP